jgi:hypothetical protein
MKLIVLDDFPPWTTYLLGLLVLCGFLLAVAILLRSLLASSGNSSGSRTRVRRGRKPWFFAIAGALAVWFLGSSMYLRFHAVGIEPQHIELVFFWPRTPVVLEANDVVAVKLTQAYRTCGHLEVATERELFRSVNFKNCKLADEILKEVPHRSN